MANDILKPPSLVKNNAPTKEELAKRPWCHRIFTPVAYGEQVQLPGHPATMQMKTDVSLMKCLEAQCTLWDLDAKGCVDKIGTRAARETAAALKILASRELEKKGEATLLDVGG